MAYGYYRALTVDHTKLGASDLASFPVLVAGTYSFLATTANGGRLQSASGYDFVFAQDAAGTQPLSFERVNWSATTGKIECWVKFPTLSHSVDTVFYLLYGDAGISTDQSNKTAVWSNSFNGVWHLGDGSTVSAADSTANGYNGTITSVSAISGEVGGAMSINGSAGNGIQFGDVLGAAYNDFTLSTWFKTTVSQYAPMVGKRDTNSTYRFAIAVGFVDSGGQPGTSTCVGLTLYDGSWRQSVRTAATYGDGSWHLAHATRSGASLQIYVDGVNQTLTVDQLDVATANASPGGNFFLGYDGTRTLNGAMDEARAAYGVVRSADWILTEYNNQASPATFYALGAEQTPGGGGGAVTPRLFALLGCGA